MTGDLNIARKLCLVLSLKVEDTLKDKDELTLIETVYDMMLSIFRPDMYQSKVEGKAAEENVGFNNLEEFEAQMAKIRAEVVEGNGGGEDEGAWV